MSAETPNIGEVRAHAQAVIDRANADSGFANRLKADPEGAQEAGLEDQAILTSLASSRTSRGMHCAPSSPA
jgi:hypothetical protein